MPYYMYINGMKQEMDEDLFDQMAAALHQSSNPPQSTNSNIHKMETARGYFNDFKNSLKTRTELTTRNR